ncbi:MAG: hypothetical protein AB1486_25535 [Planctomycetota bacterium]
MSEINHESRSVEAVAGEIDHGGSSPEEAPVASGGHGDTPDGPAPARPLKALVPLIKREIKYGFEAGKRHWLALGRLLNEARRHFPESGPNANGQTFHEWVAENFTHPVTGEPINERTTRRWIEGARTIPRLASRTQCPGPSLRSVTCKDSPSHPDYKPELDWKRGVRKVQRTINIQAMARQFDDRRREVKELRKIAKKIIAAGYRALAAVVHPDKPGGSNEAMAMLTKAKDWLLKEIDECQWRSW